MVRPRVGQKFGLNKGFNYPPVGGFLFAIFFVLFFYVCVCCYESVSNVVVYFVLEKFGINY